MPGFPTALFFIRFYLFWTDLIVNVYFMTVQYKKIIGQKAAGIWAR